MIKKVGGHKMMKVKKAEIKCPDNFVT